MFSKSTDRKLLHCVNHVMAVEYESNEHIKEDRIMKSYSKVWAIMITPLKHFILFDRVQSDDISDAN